MYPTQVKMKQAPTFKRVFEHTDNLAARDWKTHNSETFGEVQGQYQNSQKHGKRASREMAKLMELARQEPAEEPKRMTFATTNRADYVEQELKGLAYGARVMKTQDGGAVRRDRGRGGALAERRGHCRRSPAEWCRQDRRQSSLGGGTQRIP